MTAPRDPSSVQSRVRAYLQARKGLPVRYSELVRALDLTKPQVWTATSDLVRFKCAERVRPHAVRALESSQ